jgi:cytochrome P450
MSERDWATDFDHTDPEWGAHAPQIWDELRQRCPVAHSEKFGGTWLPTRHSDIAAIAADTEHFSSQGVIVTEWKPFIPAPVGYAPPITSDPPFHEIARRILLPAFSPKAVAPLEAATRSFCRSMLEDLTATAAENGGIVEFDAAVDYAQHIPVHVIAHMLGVPESDGDRFRVFIHRILERAGQNAPIPPGETLSDYIAHSIAARRGQPSDDLIGFLMNAEIDGVALTTEHITGTIALLLIAGIDTTWSAIGATLWHLSQHPADVARLRAEPELLLRFYAPVTMARIAATDTEIGGCPVAKGDWVLLPFPAANRDPGVFDRADELVIDRERNRHAAFGLGIHRCLGSNLARMELRVAVEEWLRISESFELAAPDDPESVRWATGQVRGPRTCPVRMRCAVDQDVSDETNSLTTEGANR